MHDGYNVYGWGEYEEGSVLEGQTRRVHLGYSPAIEEATAVFPFYNLIKG